MWSTYWFEIVGEYSDICSEEFFTELHTAETDKKALKAMHIEYAESIFPGEVIKCLGRVSAAEAEMMGLDTY